MSRNNLKNTALGLSVLCFILLSVAVERYQANAASVAAANQMLRSSPFGPNAPLGLNVFFGPGQPVAEITPGVPVITTYAALFAFLSAVGAAPCFVKSRA